MSGTLGKSPFSWFDFDFGKDGALRDDGAAAAAAIVGARGISDLVVMSHGWKNTREDARRLYETLWGNVCAALQGRDPAAIAVCGVVWPAKAYATDLDDGAAATAGALSVRADGGVRDLTDLELKAALADFADVFSDGAGPSIDAARAMGGGIDSEAATRLFDAAVRALDADGADSELRADLAPIVGANDPQALLVGLAQPPDMRGAPAGTKGLGDGVGTLLHGPRAAVARFLNQLTYFEMKKRAGLVGSRLGAEVLPAVMGRKEVRLHMIGHSFGARLVTAAAAELPDAERLFSVTLLQGAFSQNALAAEISVGVPGAFAKLLGRPTGPIAMTHTHEDRACTFWYPLASRLSRDVSQGFGDKNDIFGAMGANGAQMLEPEALAPDVAGDAFHPVPGKVNRFLADTYIRKAGNTDAHNNVANATVGRLVAAVITTPA